MNKTIVVITPVMNAVAFIDETIRSVISQTGSFSIRYHVQDGGSSDGTVQLLKRWEEKLRNGNSLGGANVKFSWVSERDRGMYQAINKGFAFVEPEFATTEVVALTWINSDDILLTNSLKTVFDYFTKNPTTQWITGVSTLMTEAGTLADTSSTPTAFSQAALANGQHDGRGLPFVQQEGTFFRPSLWNLCSGLDENFRLAGDWDLWRRFACHAELVKLRCVLAVHRRRPGQLSASMSRYYQEVDAARRTVQVPANLNSDAWFSLCPANETNWANFKVASSTLNNEATLRAAYTGRWDRIDFRDGTFPPWVASISGLSGIESFGRWSDANLAPTIRVVSFAAFPAHFQLKLRVRALTSEENSPATIRIAGKSFTMDISDTFTDIQLDVENDCDGNTIDIAPRCTTSPLERGWSADNRRLGLGVEYIIVNDISEG
jgi:glycosyltransferase involved in cell wall biosynthesis